MANTYKCLEEHRYDHRREFCRKYCEFRVECCPPWAFQCTKPTNCDEQRSCHDCYYREPIKPEEDEKEW